MMTDAFIALGSNLGDRAATLTSAIDSLRRCDHVDIVAVSAFVETDPVGQSGQGRYLNAAAWLRTELAPVDLLETLLTIEKEHGRTRSPDQRWGSRTLDLDLLLFGEQIINQPGLTIPHPEMHRRSFVLVPLAQIAPSQNHPVLKRTVRDLLDSLQSAKPTEFQRVQVGS